MLRKRFGSNCSSYKNGIDRGRIDKGFIVFLAFIVVLATGFFMFKNFKKTQASSSQDCSLAKADYLDINSPDFDPRKAKKPNPRKKVTNLPPCCSHPYYHSVWRAFSKNGRTSWSKENKKYIDHASVPDVLVKSDGTQIVYYVNGIYDTMDCRIIKNNKKMPGKCRIYDFSGKKAWDPEVVKVKENYYRMYFMSPPQIGSSFGSTIKTAISKDGITWLEEGTALGKGNEILIDPTVIKVGSKWLMIVNSETRGLLRAVSSNGRSFKLQGNVGGIDGASPHLTKLKNSYGLYYCKEGIEVSFSKNAKIWSGEITALENEPGNIICDPSVEEQKNGKYVMYYKKQSTTTNLTQINN